MSKYTSLFSIFWLAIPPPGGDGEPDGVDKFNEDKDDSDTEFLACILHMQQSLALTNFRFYASCPEKNDTKNVWKHDKMAKTKS